MNHEELVEQLVSQFRWSREQIELGLRDRFKCRYCDKDLLASVDKFKEWTLDHIVPKSKLKEGAEDPQNIAVACWVCNVIKRQWDPRTTMPLGNREDLIEVVRKFLDEKRAHLEEDLSKQRELVTRLRESWRG